MRLDAVAHDLRENKVRTDRKTKAEVKDSVRYDVLFTEGIDDGYDAGKNDCINDIVDLSVFSDENRDLNDAYTVGFEVGFLRAVAEFHLL